MMRLPFSSVGPLVAFTAFLYSAPSALACACCAETGHRLVQTEGLKERHTAEINQLRFAKTAKLMVSADEDERRIRGVSDPAENYEVEVTRAGDLLTFTFRDEKSRAGTLSFRLPNTIAIFEVDPRERDGDKGLGPTLYKEWRITAFSTKGDGLFKPSVTRNTKIALILHGRGNACTSYDQFSAWTLQVFGPAAKFTLYGRLDSGDPVKKASR